MYLASYCFNGMYILQLWGAYGFGVDAPAGVTLEVNDNRGLSVGWGLGFMLAQTNWLVCSSGEPDLAGSAYAACIAISSLVLLASAGALAYLGASYLRNRGYSPV